MEGLFKDVLREEESLFRNEEVFDFEYLPEVLPYRDEQKHYIASSVKPLFYNRKPRNLFISGPPGVGKTSCAQFVFKELRSFSDDVVPFYINCWKTNTSFSVFRELSRQMGSSFTEGRSAMYLFEQIEAKVKEKRGVVALDEIDKAQEYDFLYRLSGLKNVCLILITNKSGFLSQLDGRIRSRLVMEDLFFFPYGLRETEEILRRRVEVGFVEGAWPGDAFGKVVKETFKRKDIRAGLFLLREAARFAEAEAKRKVGLLHVESAREKLVGFSIKSADSLRDDDRLILELVKKNDGITTGRLFEFYKVNGGRLSERSFRRYLLRMKKQDLLRIRKTGKGFQGRSQMVFFSGF